MKALLRESTRLDLFAVTPKPTLIAKEGCLLYRLTLDAALPARGLHRNEDILERLPVGTVSIAAGGHDQHILRSVWRMVGNGGAVFQETPHRAKQRRGG